ncbi:hypothetical protein Tco_1527627 [Tanacetum coccineum]
MSTLEFAETHNLVSFLEKPEESNGFDGIIDFLNASSIKYALTVNPTVYESRIQQFWATSTTKTVNGERQIQALVDKKKVIITEKSVRSDLMLEDAEGTECLLNDVIFEQLTLIGAKTTTWNEFSSTIASAIIYNQVEGITKHRLQLTELMSLYTTLQEKVPDLEEAKTAQAKEIASLKKRAK